jgi:spore germination protein YaaH
MTRQVYFENERSLRAKYELIKANDLAGVGIWALGYDGGYQELWNLLKEQFVTN